MSSSTRAKAKARAAIATALARTAVRDAVVQRAATAHMLAKAKKIARAGPRGMGGSRTLYARNATNGSYAVDPVSLDRIPVRRVVRVGKQAFNSKTVRALLERDPAATNPLTRQPFPDHVYRRYGKRQPQYSPDKTEAMAVLWAATRQIVDAFFNNNASRFSDIPEAWKTSVQATFDVEVDYFEEPGVSILNVTLGEFVSVAEHVVGRPREQGMVAQLWGGNRLLQQETLMPWHMRRRERVRMSARR